MSFHKSILMLAAVGAIGLAAPAAANDVEVELSGTRISLDQASARGLSNFTLRVVGPNGYIAEVFSRRSAPSLRLTDYGDLADGEYAYEFTAATQERRQWAVRRQSSDNGRSGNAQPGFVGTQQSGSFRVLDGRIIVIDANASEN